MKERIFRAIVGSMMVASVSLAYFVNINWLWLGVFVGLNLIQSSFTKFCPLERILKGFGVNDQSLRKSSTGNLAGRQGCCPVE
jgi:hypothetical protein